MRKPNSQQKKLYMICGAISLVIIYFICRNNLEEYYQNTKEMIELRKDHIIIENSNDNSTTIQTLKQWIDARKNISGNFSKLGRILFLYEKVPNISSSDKRYKILLWKYGSTIENRHLKRFSNKFINPFQDCSVNNCDIIYENSSLPEVDIVIFHMHRMKGITDLPNGVRNPKQIWAFLTDESPYHTIMKSGIKLNSFNGLFNWSMSYKFDSDIPVPYGRTVVKSHIVRTELVLNKRRDVLIAIMGSNCGGQNDRWKYVEKLQKYIQVDVYGGCGTIKTCPGHFTADCPDLDKYLFYLSFENSNCDDYITEKVWWNAYHKNSIPIVMGASPNNYKLALPPGSYINVDDFASPAVLAQYIHRLNKTNEFTEYYKWKNDFKVLNEHGYFKSKSVHYCRICQALNYNDKSKKVYNNLDDFLSIKRDCHPAWNSAK